MGKIVAILGYHKIGPPSPGAWETWYYVPTATFERQMKQLRDGGWNVIDVATMLAALDDPARLPQRAAMITFDDAGRSPESTDAILRGAGYKAAFHFVGGAAHWPPGNPFHLSRIPVWPDSDFSKGLTDQADRR